jgi:tetratricopeptide (TPR) repeat protein
MPDKDTGNTEGKGNSNEGGRMTEREENDIDLIEKYYSGKLSAQEQLAVKARMESDPAFAGMATDYIDIIEGVKRAGKEKFKATVTQWEAEIVNEQQHISEKPGLFRNYWQLAAVFLLIALAAIYIFIPGGKQSPQELYVDYFVPYEDVISLRDVSNPLITECIHLYNEKKFDLAAERFSKYLTETPNDLDAQFYLGVSLLGSARPEESISTFGMVITGNGLLKEQAEWYRALAYLKRGDVETTKRLLNDINHEGHDYRTKAAELLGKL